MAEFIMVHGYKLMIFIVLMGSLIPPFSGRITSGLQSDTAVTHDQNVAIAYSNAGIISHISVGATFSENSGSKSVSTLGLSTKKEFASSLKNPEYDPFGYTVFVSLDSVSFVKNNNPTDSLRVTHFWNAS